MVVAGDSTPVAGQRVDLHRVTADSGFVVDSALTDERGRFAFRLEAGAEPASGEGAAGGTFRAVHLVSARYQEVLYFGPAVHGSRVPDPYVVVVHRARPAAADDSLRVRRRTLVVAPHEAGARVLDAVDLGAAGRETLVGPGEGEAWWSLALPEGATGPSVLPGGIEAGEVSFAGGRVAGRAAVPPTGRRLVIGYGLEAPRIRLRPERPVERLEVVYRGGAPAVAASGLRRSAPATGGDTAVTRFVGRSVEAGRLVEVSWGREGDGSGWLGWALLGLGLLLAAGAYLAWRRLPPGGAAAVALLAAGTALAGPTPAAAGPPAGADTMVVTDDQGERVTLTGPPRRVVSLVPALTEILFAIGAGDRLVGRTKYGVHPPEARAVPSVGEGVRPSAELVTSRDPDLVLVYAGAENRSTLDQFRRLGIPALAVRHDTFDDLHRNVRRLGRLAGRQARAERLSRAISCRLEAVARAVREAPRKRVYYEVWGRPPVTVGGGSYLDSLVTVAGGVNVFGELEAPSPRVSLEAVVERRPDVLVLPVESGGGDRVPPGERPGWDALRAVREGAVRRVDGDLLHRLGPRVGEAAVELAAALHPDLEEEVRSAAEACGTEGVSAGDRAPGPARPRAARGAGG